MLKLVMHFFYHDKIYTSEPRLFYKLYKWNCGMFTLLSLRKVIISLILSFIGIICLIFIKNKLYCLIFACISLLFVFLEIMDFKKTYITGEKITPSQIRTLRVVEFIRKIVSTHGRALGRKEWNEIKKHDFSLYNDLLSDKCYRCCYFYSLEIAKIIKDSILLWGAIEDPFIEGNNHYAHAVIFRRGYIYDTNMRQSERFEDFVKLYNFKPYKQWTYDEYSQKNFRDSERLEFRKWCRKHNVLSYQLF